MEFSHLDGDVVLLQGDTVHAANQDQVDYAQAFLAWMTTRLCLRMIVRKTSMG